MNSGKNGIIPFTPLQEQIFSGLLSDLIASIQPGFIPPAGPLPNVFKILQNLFKSMRLGLRDQADLFAATELPITAYEQSDGWTPALIAATQTALTELYAFSLLGCVSSPVKDGWVSQIRTAETNLAGISGAVPPVISGTVISLDGGKVETALSFSLTTALPTEGAIPVTDFTSKSIPVTTNDIGQNVSIVLADQFGGNNFAFSMPRSGTLTAITASFSPNDLTITGTFIVALAQLCRALPDASPYGPFTAIPGTLVQLSPGLTGDISGITFQGSLNSLNIPLNPEDRLVLVFTLVASIDSNPNVTTIQGTLGGTIAIEPVNAPPSSVGPIIPIASNQPVNLDFSSEGFGTSAGIVGFGFSENQDFFSFGLPINVSSQLANFTSPLAGDGIITAFAAYFGIDVSQTSSLEQPITVLAEIYKYSPSTNEVSPMPDTLLHVGDFLQTTITEATPGVHGLKTGLNISVNEGDRLVLVFTVLSAGTVSGGLVQGWASGGISIGPSSS
ncbi:hypothetical protein [Paenibacillus herberti]|uniref:Uncharacterized protein n=1 Tax=Paenibacillus herberti TaxID=1619309 RepID=A0A229P4M5_9BACL|nr:hypothetical protein [Paenibacillus herberti]OXM17213.1 hypothetical protein CGZ75_11570 [Paenibacillus herberti]